jgi:hypothetical protein
MVRADTVYMPAAISSSRIAASRIVVRRPEKRPPSRVAATDRKLR